MTRNFIEILQKLGPLFWSLVITPVVISTIYFGLISSDVYISESQFLVRSPDKPATTGLGILLKSTGFSSSGDEVFTIRQYIKSRDALQAVNKDSLITESFTRPDVSFVDRFALFGFNNKFEDLYDYYQKYISIDQDSTSNISILKVRAYTPGDARKINERLLELAEATVNKLNERGRQDLIRFAQAEVDMSEQRARNAALELAAYRNRQGVVDPEKQAAVQLQMISKLQDQLISSKIQLGQLQSFTPSNPQIESLALQVRSLQREIDDQLARVAGNPRSLSSSVARYQRLVLDSQFADKNLAIALASLEEAKNEARRKQAYVERVVQPNLPDKPLEPRRLRAIFSTLVLGLVAWAISSMLLAGLREHRD